MTLTLPFKSISTAILGRLLLQVTEGGDGGADVLTQWPTADFSEPASGLWIAPTIREGDRVQVDIGSAYRSRTVGVLFVECFALAGTGTKDLELLAERVRVAFDRYATSGLQFRTCSLVNGSSGDRVGKWWRLTVQAPFYADDSS